MLLEVQVGEQSYCRDFIDPPFMLGSERSRFGSTQEMNWSRATYMEPAEVEKAFELERPLGKPKGVAPNQVFPFKKIYKYGLMFFGLLCLLGFAMLIVSPSRKVYEHTFQLRNLTAQTTAPVPGQPIALPPPEKFETFLSDKFELKSRRNVKVTVSCPQLDGYLAVEGDLVQDGKTDIQPVFVGMSHYSGTEDGEAWTEGEHSASQTLSSQAAGSYSLKLEVEKEHANFAGPMTVTIEQGSASGFMWFLVLLGIVGFPAAVGIYHFTFNSTRWSNSSIEPPDEPESVGEVELESAKYLNRKAIDEPLPMADEAAPESPRPVGRVVKKKKKRQRDDDEYDDE
jgi:hypothetical protein